MPDAAPRTGSGWIGWPGKARVSGSGSSLFLFCSLNDTGADDWQGKKKRHYKLFVVAATSASSGLLGMTSLNAGATS
ncbi:MAG: hypothetical protein H7147_07490 [Frankiaceae bacterium]|nr:hypothetical protein [Arenimonas sp.]